MKQLCHRFCHRFLQPIAARVSRSPISLPVRYKESICSRNEAERIMVSCSVRHVMSKMVGRKITTVFVLAWRF